MTQIKYTDIGHSHKNDILWIMIEDELNVIAAGESRTHELVWGGEANIEDHWRGRYELSTAYCSIVPPNTKLGLRRPPNGILSQLRDRFSIVRFCYFTNGAQSFSPNPRKR